MVVGEFTQETDLLVIGGGPAGYSCAFRAAELGVQTLIVDNHPSERLGGICLHDGCIPSKTLLHVAEWINGAKDAAVMGVKFGKPTIDLDAIRTWKDEAVSRLARGLEGLCKKHNMERLTGTAHFEDSRHVAIVGGSVPRVRFRRAVIATGSRPVEHEVIPFKSDAVWTPAQAVHIPEIPRTLLVIGGNYNAVELASLYAALGSAVTLVHDAERILPDADADLTRPLDKRLEDRLKLIVTKVRVSRVTPDKQGVKVRFEGEGAPDEAKFHRVIVALGHAPNTHELRLAATNVQVNADGFISVDEQMRTTDPRIYAAGDVTGAPLLADKALHQGRICGEVLAGWGSIYDARTVPMTVFTDPQLAWCGLTEQEATSNRVPHEVVRIPWGASGRAVGMGRSEGITMIIFEPDTKLVLGVGMCGPHACEMIAEGALAIEMGATLTDLAATIHPHPTLTEMIADAARQAAQ